MQPTEPLPEDLIDMKQAARLAKCGLQCMYRWALKGKLRSRRRSGRLFVSQAEVLGLFQEVMRPARQMQQQGASAERCAEWARRILDDAGV